MDLEDDRHLAERMVAGEKHAFDDFFNRYFDRLYRFALVRLDQDSHAAEDVVQQTLCRAMQRIGLYKGEAALFTWLCRICRNTIADTFRAKDRPLPHTVPFEDNEEIRTALEWFSAMATDDPHESLLSQQVRRLVHVVLDYLPTRYGNVLELKYIEGLSVKEISQRMKVGPKAVESLLGRARVAFREAFAVIHSADELDVLVGGRR